MLYNSLFTDVLQAKICVVQSPLVIVDSSVSGKMSTITSNSTITGEIHAKIDNQSAQSVHYNEKFHYYAIHYYERPLYYMNPPVKVLTFFRSRFSLL